jgi:trimeric autotransporter adhesin
LGATTIVATSGPASGSVSATVDASDISSLAVAPGSPTIAQTTSQQFSAVGTFNDGSTHDLTNQVTWTSSDTAVAAIGKTNGIAKGLTAGTATISAAVGALSASADLTVTNATVTSIAVTPTARTIPAGTRLAYTATGSFSDSTNQVITRDVTWASDNVAVASIGSSALATAIAPGNANISATLNSVTGSTSLSVNSVTLTAISVAPATAALAPASTLFYGATGTYSDGSTRAITNAVQWSSSATNVATITSGGQATGTIGWNLHHHRATRLDQRHCRFGGRTVAADIGANHDGQHDHCAANQCAFQGNRNVC